MTKTYKIYLVAGARPNFIKIAPILRALQNYKDKIDAQIIHTGQHYDYEMSQVFFEQLGIPEPDFYLDVGSGSHAFQTAQVMIRFEKLLIDDRPDLVVVLGDVNSTLAGALTAVKLHIPVAHIEAGLRSFDKSMPEEINRILTDHISDLLFTTEPVADANLAKEGIESEKIHLVGNVMIDALINILPVIENNDTTDRLGLNPQSFGVVTLHRPSNVDSENALRKVLAVLRNVISHGKIIFPAHPRTIKNIEKFNIRDEFESLENLEIIEPLGYIDFMNLVKKSKFVMTDSGGIQTETTWLGVPCITLRENTEHVITIENGTNHLTGLDLGKIQKAFDWIENFDKSKYKPPEIWDGKAAERIVMIILKHFHLN